MFSNRIHYRGNMPQGRWRRHMLIGLISPTFAACSSHTTIYSPKPGANDMTTCRLVGNWLLPRDEAASASVDHQLIDVATNDENQGLVRAGHAALNAWHAHNVTTFKSRVNHMIATCATFGPSVKDGSVPVS